MQGWIKAHRSLLTSPVFQNEKLLKVFMWCILRATHTEHEQVVGRQTVPLNPGQFVFGRKSAALELGMKESSVYDYMKILQKDATINIKSGNKFSVVTVVNWDFYQGEDDVTNNKSDSKSTANQQQIDTNKNVKKEKNEKKKTHYAEFVMMTEDEYSKLVQAHSEPFAKRCIEVLDNYKGSKGKKYASDYRAILTWVVGRVKEDQAQKGPAVPIPGSAQGVIDMFDQWEKEAKK